MVINSGSTYKGLYHPCGAFNAVVVADRSSPFYNPNGSINIVQNPLGGYTPAMPNGLPIDIPTNLLLHSGDFSQWANSGVTVTTNVVNDPIFQSLSADRLTETATNAAHSVNSNAVNVIAGTTYTLSVYAKYENSQFIQLLLGSGGFGLNAYGNFDIQNGLVQTVGSSASGAISNAGNGWYRCKLTSTATATASTASAIFCANSGSMTRAFGYLGVATNTRLLCNSQMEVGTTSGIYIPTA